LTLVFAEIPVHNLPSNIYISLVKSSSTLFPSQYYVFIQLDFKVKSIYGTQISKYVISTE